MTVDNLWHDTTPSRRCDWIDQLRGWAVIVMIEVHCVNVWLPEGMIPGWLNYLNGLVAPSFILCAGYSLALSTFRPDGSIRPFAPTAKRLGFILLCAYALHVPGVTLADWTVMGTPQRFRELFKIDVLQCIVFSLLILQGMARLIRRPAAYAFAALAAAAAVAWAAPFLWRPGVADGWWLPVRGLVNGNTDRGVTALFPLFPWFSFAAFGSVLGAAYRHMRVLPAEGGSRWSEARWLTTLAASGALLILWGTWQSGHSIWSGTLPASEADRLYNATLPSVVQRIGMVCAAGGVLGWVQLLRKPWPGPAVVDAASRESLLVYMLHLNLIFGVLLAAPIRSTFGWGWHALGWWGTLTLTAFVIALDLAAAVAWQRIREDAGRMRRLQRLGLAALGVWFLAGGWWSYRRYLESPELAREPFTFLSAARARKGLPPTPDGMSHDPLEIAREKARRKLRLSDEERRLLESQRG
ncbi:MAG TPA: heparan-alpha-glucosaminide N-acetyltransferase domain-containing protein [Holophaga sp.]|nr:heparan-alpha-glucosaminide N-acetyltransferase domain-containing protein [Holophaga sp.]